MINNTGRVLVVPITKFLPPKELDFQRKHFKKKGIPYAEEIDDKGLVRLVRRATSIQHHYYLEALEEEELVEISNLK